MSILNVYNEKDVNRVLTLDRLVYRQSLLPNTLLLGDFNIRHPMWDPHGQDTSQRAETFAN